MLFIVFWSVAFKPDRKNFRLTSATNKTKLREKIKLKTETIGEREEGNRERILGVLVGGIAWWCYPYSSSPQIDHSGALRIKFNIKCYRVGDD